MITMFRFIFAYNIICVYTKSNYSE